MTARLRAGWTRLHPKGASKCSAAYRHDATGWVVKHCGHPTANWPYYASAPDGSASLVIESCGRAFRLLDDACRAVEDLVAGTRTLEARESDRYGLVWLAVPTWCRNDSSVDVAIGGDQ